MNRFVRGLSLAAELAIYTPATAAEGGLACVIEDDVLSLSLSAAYAAGRGDGLLGVSGTVGVKYNGTPRAMGPLRLHRQSVAQYWFQSGELKLLVAKTKERRAKSLSVIIRLDLKQGRTDPTIYRGNYVLEVRHRDATTTGAGADHKASSYAECTANPKG